VPNETEKSCASTVIDADIIAVSVSWANNSIGDRKLNLEGYTLFRKDRVLDINICMQSDLDR